MIRHADGRQAARRIRGAAPNPPRSVRGCDACAVGFSTCGRQCGNLDMRSQKVMKKLQKLLKNGPQEPQIEPKTPEIDEKSLLRSFFAFFADFCGPEGRREGQRGAPGGQKGAQGSPKETQKATQEAPRGGFGSTSGAKRVRKLDFDASL